MEVYIFVMFEREKKESSARESGDEHQIKQNPSLHAFWREFRHFEITEKWRTEMDPTAMPVDRSQLKKKTKKTNII